jgi:hypothetical protein
LSEVEKEFVWVTLEELGGLPVSKSVEELFSSKNFKGLFNSGDK